jgi:2-hydroxy-3-oxopropionate reductase
MADVGFIGLGIMGRPMAMNLLKAGRRLLVPSSSAAAAEMAAGGAELCGGFKDLAERAEVVILMLPNTPDVEQVLFGPDGVAEGLSPGKLVIDMSSISPLATKDYARRLAARGVDMLDAPVSGGEVGAKAATLSIMVGGPAHAVDRARPLLEAMGKTITHVGGNGDGQTAKVANQMLVGLTIAAVGEALIFASRAGADVAMVRQALLGGFAASRVLEVHGDRMIRGAFEPGFRMRLHHKDLSLALDGADELGLALPQTAACLQLFNAAAGAGELDLDHSALVRSLERLTGHVLAAPAPHQTEVAA